MVELSLGDGVVSPNEKASFIHKYPPPPDPRGAHALFDGRILGLIVL
jgi:hypothetical protein